MGVPLMEPSIHRHRYRAGLGWLGCTSLSTGTRDVGWLDNKETVTLACAEAVPTSLPEIGISGEVAASLPILTLGRKPLQRWLHGVWSSAHSNKPGATSRGASSAQLSVSLWEGLYSSQHLSQCKQLVYSCCRWKGEGVKFIVTSATRQAANPPGNHIAAGNQQVFLGGLQANAVEMSH